MTTKEDISGWFDEGRRQKATHMIVVCDTFDHDDYPVYVSATDKVREVFDHYNGVNMQRVMEVYNLGMGKDKQLREFRARNF